MVNLALAWAEAYRVSQPDVDIAVTGGGSGTGIAALINGTVDIANASREMKDHEIEDAKNNGIEPVEHLVAIDALAVIVNPANPVSQLTIDQLADIFTGRITNWQEVGGNDAPIVLVSRETNSGTHVYFLEQVVRKGSTENKDIFAPQTLLMPSSVGITSEIQRNPNAIGYDGLGYVTEHEKLIAVAKDAGSPYVLPSVASGADGSYPIARGLTCTRPASRPAQSPTTSPGSRAPRASRSSPTWASCRCPRSERMQNVEATPSSTPQRRRGEVVIEALILLAGVSTIIIVALIFFFLLKEGIATFLDIPLRQLFGTRWYPIENQFGLLPLLVGTLLVTLGAVIIAVPLGVVAAIYLGEIAPPWLRDILKPLIEILAGIPSIVLGFLGWVALAPIVQGMGAPTGLTAFTGALLLAYMALPTIISISEDALYAVPKEYRDGALAIGATQWQTIWRVVLPSARSGLVIAVMLGIGRVIGETMAVLMVTGNAANIPPLGLGMFFNPVRTMTATIAAEMGEVAQGSLHYSVLFGIGLILFLITFAVNWLAARLVGVTGARRRGGQL